MLSYKTFMDYEDILLQELMDMPGEIFDIPEMQDEKKFDVEGYINGEIDYWWWTDSKCSLNVNNWWRTLIVSSLITSQSMMSIMTKNLWRFYVMPCAKTFPLTDMNRSELQDQLIQQILDDMDMKCLLQMCYDMMDENYDKYSDEELMEEVKEYYPHILED